MRREMPPWTRKKRFWIVLSCFVMSSGFVIFVLVANLWNWQWTGFQKTLWDWMQLFIVPIALAIVAFLFNRMESNRQQKLADQRSESDQEIALDNQRDITLQTYLKQMSKLLFRQNLRTSEPKTEVRYVARAQTLTVLRRLDTLRKGYLLQFLYEAGLINNEVNGSIIDLNGADLQGAELQGLQLRKVNLGGTNLHGANLKKANLSGAMLRKADLSNTNMCEARLSQTNLHIVNLSQADLSGAVLSEADLTKAILRKALLIQADLSGADLTGTDLSDANLSGANLSGAELLGANLSGAELMGANLQGTDLMNTDLQGSRLNTSPSRGN